MTLVDHGLGNQSLQGGLSSSAAAGGGSAAANGGGSDLDKLWNLLAELSSQLSHNRQQTEELHRRAEELKTQAIHNQTGYTLRRFNLDVSQEEFESELERQNVNLVNENQSLHQENRQLSILLKDYEGTLETVMAKFRAHAHATQQHHLDLVRHYENLLLSSNATTEESFDSPSTSSQSIDPLHLNLSLSHLSSLVRKALRSLNGEDPDSLDSPELKPLDQPDPFGPTGPESTIMRNSKRDVSTGGYIGRSATTEPHYLPTTSTSSLVNSPPTNAIDAARHSSLSEDKLRKELLGPVDEALEREIEIEALRRENEVLRRALGIDEFGNAVGSDNQDR